MSTIKLEPKSSSGDQNASKLGAKDRLNYNLVNHVIVMRNFLLKIK